MAMHEIYTPQDFIDFVMSENDFPDFDKVDLVGWPRLDIKIYGDRYDGTLTPQVAKSLYDFYMELQRAYAFVKYGTPNLQRLTSEDKSLFSTVEFRIEDGCIKLLGEYAEQAKSLLSELKELTEGMDSKDKKHVVIFMGLALAGTITAYTFIDRHFDAHTQLGKADQDRQQVELMLEGQKHSIDAIAQISNNALNAMSQENRERLDGAVEQIDDGYRGIVSAAPDAEKIDFSGTAFDNDDIEEIVTRPDIDTYSEIRSDEFVIDNIRKARFPKISIRISSIESAEEYTVGFDYGDISRESYERIFDAAKNNQTVVIRYNAIIRPDGDLYKATLIDVLQGRDLFNSVANADPELDDDDDEYFN